MKSKVKKNVFDNFITWLWKPNPDTTLVNWLKRARDRQTAAEKHQVKTEQKIKVEEQDRKRDERKASQLRKADREPAVENDSFSTKTMEKLTEKNAFSTCNPYCCLENFILAPIENWMSQQALFSILEKLGYLAILVAVIEFIGGQQVRRNGEVFAAWQTITNAEGQSGSGGRKEALEFLNSRPWRFPWIGWTDEDWYWDKQEKKCMPKRLLGLRWEQQKLQGLSAPNAYLQEIRLCKANLVGAHLEGANLVGAHLENANLWVAHLENAGLKQASLEGANLMGIHLEYAFLSEANLKGANLKDANLWLVQGLTPKQVKSACNWKEANFDLEFQKKLEKEPGQEVNCTKWENVTIIDN